MQELPRSRKPIPVADLVAAREFRLVDSVGRERACLALDRDEQPYLRLCNLHGKSALLANVDAEGNANLSLHGPEGEIRILLRTTTNGEARLWFYEPGGDDPRVGLLIDDKGVAALELWARESDAGISLFAPADGEVSATLWRGDDRAPPIEL